MTDKLTIMPVIALRGMTAFPYMPMSFDVGRQKSILALEAALNDDQRVLLVAQRDAMTDDPGEDELCRWGTIARIKQVLRPKDDNLKVLIEGLERAELQGLVEQSPYLIAAVRPHKAPAPQGDEREKAQMRSAVKAFEEFANMTRQVMPAALLQAAVIESPDQLADTLIMHTLHQQDTLQSLLEVLDPCERLERFQVELRQEMELLELEAGIQARVQERMAKYQKEAFLNEQMRVIRQELGQGDEEENARLREQLEALPMPEESRKKVMEEMDRLERMPSGQPDANVIRTWLETVARMPWGIYTEDAQDLEAAEEILNEDHDGLDKVKERVLEYLAVHQLTQSLKGPILCLVGPPGVGKTSIARSIARCLNRKFVRTSLGGLRDEAELRGHRRTYIGAIPGRILSGIAQAGSANPVCLLDEIDKMRHDALGDPASAMLEILDSEQNHAFRDLYLDIPFDLSQVLFLATANSLENVPRPLLDRMEVISIEGYTPQEKLAIARHHLIPKAEAAHGLAAGTLALRDETVYGIINGYTREAGVRALEREIGNICRKAARAQVARPVKRIRITPDKLEKYLGPERVFPNELEKEPMLGMAVGLAYNSVGGDTLLIEVNTMPGSGQLILTGRLGDVMKESARAAMTYIRAHAAQFKLPKDFHKKLDIHVHVPEGATPKDGPSAGITMAVALLSALSGRRVPADLAMTGEITLRGRVLPIGGLKEKMMAAHRDGIRRVLIPRENQRDLDDIPMEIKRDIEVTPVHTLDEVLQHALLGEGEAS